MTGKAIPRAWLPYPPLVLLAVVLALYSSIAHAADPQPVLVYQNPAEGEVIQQAAFGIQLCFASPVNIKDLDKGGDFSFSVTEPDGLGLGNRDVFQPDGYGITVYPGNPIGETTGQWKFHYRLTSPDAKSALEGDINYTVDPNGSLFPQETPPACVEAGGTATPLPRANGSTSSSSNDSVRYALLAIGLAGAAAIVAILFVVRRRRGPTAQRLIPDAAAPIATSTPAPEAPPPIAEVVTPLAESSSPLSSSSPPVAETVTPPPQPSPSPRAKTPTEDSVFAESAGDRPDNSRYALLAIAAAVILLIGLLIRRRAGRRQHRGRPDGDDGNRL